MQQNYVVGVNGCIKNWVLWIKLQGIFVCVCVFCTFASLYKVIDASLDFSNCEWHAKSHRSQLQGWESIYFAVYTR